MVCCYGIWIWYSTSTLFERFRTICMLAIATEAIILPTRFVLRLNFLQNITWLPVRSKPSCEFNLLNFAPFFMVIPCLFHYRSMAGRGWFKTGSGPSGGVGRAPPCKHILTNNSAAECSAIKPNRFSLLSLSAIYPPTLLLYQVCGDGWEIGLGLTLISS